MARPRPRLQLRSGHTQFLPEMIEHLESRRLLTYTVTGTNAGETIEMRFEQPSTYKFFLNGLPAGETTDPDIVIQGLGGADTLSLGYVPNAADVTLRGGSGNDSYEVGNGRLAENLAGSVFIEELDDPDDADRLYIRDELDNTGIDRPVNIRASSVVGMTHFIRSGLSQGAGTVHFNEQFSDRVDVFSSAAADSIYVEAEPRALHLNLGAGNDTAYYGDRNTRELTEPLGHGRINGGDGVDRVVYDDWGQSGRNPRSYDFDVFRFLTSSVPEIEAIELTTRQVAGGGRNDVKITGDGQSDVLTSITIKGQQTDLYVGTSNDRLDLDSLPITINAELGVSSSYFVYNQDSNTVGNDVWVMYRQGVRSRSGLATETSSRISKRSVICRTPCLFTREAPPTISPSAGFFRTCLSPSTVRLETTRHLQTPSMMPTTTSMRSSPRRACSSSPAGWGSTRCTGTTP
jgi:hypothetical protein